MVKDLITFSSADMCIIQQQVRQRLQQMPPTCVIEESVRSVHPAQLQQVEELLARALRQGESNSALIIGPRDTGKTAMVRVALSQFTSTPDIGGSSLSLSGGHTAAAADGILVRLHGLMQTDDRRALREITRQLRLEESAAASQFGSFAENLNFLLQSLRDGSRESSKCVVFILDEFDLFCHHRNQTLLYNLFDVAQSAQNPILVLGVTCRLDAVELLEKRVRSRFSHRQLHLLPPTQEQHSDIAEHLLTIDNQQQQQRQQQQQLSASSVRQWNACVSQLLNRDNAALDSLANLHDVTRDVATLQRVLRVAVGRAGSDCTSVSAAHVLAAAQLHLKDAAPALIGSLSTLQLCLMIAMMHLTLVYEGEGMTFELVLSEYLKFTRRRSSVQCFERPVVLKEFEHLRSLELVTPLEGHGSRSLLQKEYQLVRLQIPPRILQESLSRMQTLPTELMQWAQSAFA